MRQGTPSTGSADRARACVVFLAELAKTGNVSGSARTASIDRKTAYNWRKDDDAFLEDWDDALGVATDALEAEARRRGVEGYDQPVYQGGEQVGTIRKYSDRMLEILLKGHNHRFRDRASVELSGPGGGPIRTLADLVEATEPEEGDDSE